MTPVKSHGQLPQVDIVLWGATGFIGRLLTEYLWRSYGESDQARLAIGGNNRTELETLHSSLGADSRLDLIMGDAFHEAFLQEMSRSAKLIVSTVGPYAWYGSRLVAACAENGTDYLDLAGEPQWIYRMLQEHEEAAKKSGARIIHACGFDSIPFDLGVFFLQAKAQERFGQPVKRVKMRVKSMKGGASGGTVASILNVMEEARRDPETKRILKNPYALTVDENRNSSRQPFVSRPLYDEDVDGFIAPFLMAAVNTPIVHRSNFLLDYVWGKDFQYDEAVLAGSGLPGWLRALSLTGMLGLFVAGTAFPPFRWGVQKILLPEPGQGPSRDKREAGYFELLFIGKDRVGNKLQVKVAGDRDPGYGATRKMLGEAAICLWADIPKDELPGGFWTPATALRFHLIGRLATKAGITFVVGQ